MRLTSCRLAVLLLPLHRRVVDAADVETAVRVAWADHRSRGLARREETGCQTHNHPETEFARHDQTSLCLPNGRPGNTYPYRNRQSNYNARKLAYLRQLFHIESQFRQNGESRSFATWLPIILPTAFIRLGDPAKMPNFWLINSSASKGNPVN
jgi:hypothetical protein